VLAVSASRVHHDVSFVCGFPGRYMLVMYGIQLTCCVDMKAYPGRSENVKNAPALVQLHVIVSRGHRDVCAAGTQGHKAQWKTHSVQNTFRVMSRDRISHQQGCVGV